jgi:hypothetical protein
MNGPGKSEVRVENRESRSGFVSRHPLTYSGHYGESGACPALFLCAGRMEGKEPPMPEYKIDRTTYSVGDLEQEINAQFKKGWVFVGIYPGSQHQNNPIFRRKRQTKKQSKPGKRDA